ncbi:MAG: hypothetical protein ACTSRG_02390 [Candidatus Helarchaeota archaeon]
MVNKKMVVLCIIGGILMILSGTVGSIGFFGTILNYLKTWAPQIAPVLEIVMTIFTVIATGGGVSVILGALICSGDNYGLGKFVIGLGAGMGLFGLIISLITSIYGGTIATDAIAILNDIIHGSYGFIGVILTIIARIKIED